MYRNKAFQLSSEDEDKPKYVWSQFPPVIYIDNYFAQRLYFSCGCKNPKLTKPKICTSDKRLRLNNSLFSFFGPICLGSEVHRHYFCTKCNLTVKKDYLSYTVPFGYNGTLSTHVDLPRSKLKGINIHAR